MTALALFLSAALAGCGGDAGPGNGPLTVDRFDSAAAFALIGHLTEDIGPRPAGTAASRRTARDLRGKLPGGRFEPVPGGLRNVTGVLPGRPPAIVIGAHYDTEVSPPDFVGANDGAAGVAAVIGLARGLERSLPADHREIRFVLFDGEEEPAGCPAEQFAECALRGSKAWVSSHAGEIREGRIGQLILLDYIANAGLTIKREQNSDEALWAKLRLAADAVGAGVSFPEGTQPGIIDDHYPFLGAGIPSIDLIDFSYRYRDSSEDTIDKLDPAVLDAVGESVASLVLGLAAEPG